MHASDRDLYFSSVSHEERPVPLQLDIANLNGSTTDREKMYRFLSSDVTPPTSFDYPKTEMYGYLRSFQPSWLKTFPWLVYSIQLDGIFCKYCFFFATGPMLGGFVKRPVKNWVKAHGECKAHDKMKHHQRAILQAQDFIFTYKDLSQAIDIRAESAVAKRIQTNRDVIGSVVKTILLCGRQNIALRDHRDDSTHDPNEVNKGNFQELVRFRADAGDEALKGHMETAAKNATYLSKTTQNEVISLIGEEITSHILDEVKQAKFYTVLMDEVTDRSNWEQLSVVIRYVDSSCHIQEKFMAFVQCESVTVEAITNKLLDLLQNWGLPLQDMRGQGYDGGSNMAGAVKGVQGRITAINDKAIYIHCAAHCLNLAIVKACQIPVFRNVMGTLQEICLFFNNSPKRQRVLEETIEKEAPTTKQSKLVDLCKTRWVERHHAFETFSELYEVILSCLESIIDTSRTWDSETLIKARGLVACLTNFEFLTTFIVAKNCLRYLKPVRVNIQQRSKDIIGGYKEIDAVRMCLQDMRDSSESYFDVMYEECRYMASRVDVEPAIPCQCRRQTLRANTPASSPEEYYRRTVFIPFLDYLLAELQSRFSKNSQLVTDGLQLTPEIVSSQPTAAVPNGLRLLAELYSQDLPSLEMLPTEYHRWWRRWKNEDGSALPSTAQESLLTCDEAFFPNIHTLLRIVCTVPVTTAECERSISTLKRIKTYLRSTMTNERLNGLALMNIHYRAKVKTDVIVDKFAMRNSRRMRLLPSDFLSQE